MENRGKEIGETEIGDSHQFPITYVGVFARNAWKLVTVPNFPNFAPA